MLSMKEAVTKAKNYAQELYADENIQDLSLEEIDFDNQDNKWKITLGYNTKRHKLENNAQFYSHLAIKALNPLITSEQENLEIIREYKVFEINAHDGHLIKMIIRKF